jgi:hypothetical protein
MPSRHRREALPGSSPRGSLLLSLVNRVSSVGTAMVVTVGLLLAAIVEQKVLPVGSHRPPVAAPAPVRSSPRPTFPSRSAPHRKRVSPAALLSRQVQRVAITERGPVARREYGGGTVGSPVVLLGRMDSRHTWAFGTEAIPPPHGMTALPDSSLYLAHATGKTWKVALAGTPGFAALLRTAPATVLPAAERPVLQHYDAAVKAAADTGLMLPWSVGQSWTIFPASNGASGFDGGDGRVLAATAGRLYRLCSSSPDRGLVLLIRDDGIATEYYQLNEITQVPDGGVVKQGDYLGRTSTDQPCGGGAAPRRMVRFGLRNAAGPIPLDGMKLSGWTLHLTPAAMFAERDGLRVDAGNPLLNFGMLPAPTPTLSPSTAPSRSPKMPAPGPLLPSEGVNGQK